MGVPLTAIHCFTLFLQLYMYPIYVYCLRAVLVGSSEWSMIVTSCHDLIAIATSVPLVNKIKSFLSGRWQLQDCFSLTDWLEAAVSVIWWLVSSGQCYRLVAAGAHQHCARKDFSTEWVRQTPVPVLVKSLPPHPIPAPMHTPAANDCRWVNGVRWHGIAWRRMILQQYSVLINDRDQEF